jgi:hypothetical protein
MCLSLAWSGNVILARLVVRTTPSKKFRTRGHVECTAEYEPVWRPPPAAHALHSSPSPATRSCSSFALLMRYSCSRPLCAQLFNHFIHAAWHIATDGRLDHHGVTDMEFMRRHREPPVAASSHTAAAPPISVMNLRRLIFALIRSPRRRRRAVSREYRFDGPKKTILPHRGSQSVR